MLSLNTELFLTFFPETIKVVAAILNCLLVKEGGAPLN